MKYSKLIFLIFIFITIILISPRFEQKISCFQTDETSGDIFYDRLAFDKNLSLIYIFLEGESLDINIQCNQWYNVREGNPQGMLIEIKDDITENTIESWLIVYGDLITHYFTTTQDLTGVYQIIFSAINIDIVDFHWENRNNNPIWSYDQIINNLTSIYFGIERNAISYESIDRINIELTLLDLDEELEKEITISLSSSEIEYQVLYEGNLVDDNQITSFVEDGLVPHTFYKLDFECSINIQETMVQLRLFYDHLQKANIARIFLSIGDHENLDTIPLDTLHSHPDFLWEKKETIIVPPISKPDYKTNIIIIASLLLFYYATIASVLWWLAKVSNKKRRKSDVQQPSEKYQKNLADYVSYFPNQIFELDFKGKVNDYKLITNSESKITCSICMQIIKNTEDIIRCPSCDIAFHKNHLYEWIKISGSCPACKAKLQVT